MGSPAINFQLLDDGSASATLTTLDPKGNAIPFPAGASIPVWASSDPNVTVAAATDGQSATITDSGTLVTGVVITATATLADGTTTISGTGVIDVVADASKPTGFKVAFATGS
jgi:hypothetical protein